MEAGNNKIRKSRRLGYENIRYKPENKIIKRTNRCSCKKKNSANSFVKPFAEFPTQSMLYKIDFAKYKARLHHRPRFFDFAVSFHSIVNLFYIAKHSKTPVPLRDWREKSNILAAVVPAAKKLVRVTGLEPVCHTTHAPQTCLSASSSTPAYSLLLRTSTTILLYHSFSVLSIAF